MANYYAVPLPTFQKAMRNILTITSGNPTVIVTTYDGVNPGAHNYDSGLILRTVIPDGWGMQQLNNLTNIITVIDQFTFSIPVDSTNFDPFVVPALFPGSFSTPPQVVPIGEINSILTEATRNVLPYP